MLPEQLYPELGVLIKGLPQLFKHSEVIGVFLGNEICASFMHNAEQLDKIVFYENFTDIPDPKHHENLKQLYKQWESEVPNLTVLLDDGINFDVTANFVYHDMNMPLWTFFTSYGKQLKNSLIANCGFGISLSNTIVYTKYIECGLMFPIMQYRDILFYTFNKDKKDIISELIHGFLLENNMTFNIDTYHSGTIINLKHQDTYEDLLDNQFNDR